MDGSKKIPVAVLGATGTIGQHFTGLLHAHPWFELQAVAASARSAGKPFKTAIAGRERKPDLPDAIAGLTVLNVESDLNLILEKTQLVFSALSLPKPDVRKLECAYAGGGAAVVSSNSAHRWTEDVPVIIPEVNPGHTRLLDHQRKQRGWTTGCIVAKPNCSIQSYVPVLEALKQFQPQEVIVSTYQAVSGAGRTMASWPEMHDNVIPYIPGEEQKSEQEPLKIWGTITNGRLKMADRPLISTNCIRIPVTDGHMAAVHVSFKVKPNKNQIIEAIEHFENPLSALDLPSAPKTFLHYYKSEDRPQTALDRDLEKGMGIAVGRLREDHVLDYKFIALSHNTLRGGAGGAVLAAELMARQGIITSDYSRS